MIFPCGREVGYFGCQFPLHVVVSESGFQCSSERSRLFVWVLSGACVKATEIAMFISQV